MYVRNALSVRMKIETHGIPSIPLVTDSVNARI